MLDLFNQELPFTKTRDLKVQVLQNNTIILPEKI